MAIILDATVGGPAANTYVTLVEADAYFDERTHADAWLDQRAEEKKAALVRAARELDLLPWAGEAVTAEQRRAWPRWDVALRSGFRAAPDAIPLDIKDAQCELALEFVRSGDTDPTAPDDSERIASLSAGKMSITFNNNVRVQPGPRSYPAVMSRVMPYLSGGMGGTVVRA